MDGIVILEGRDLDLFLSMLGVPEQDRAAYRVRVCANEGGVKVKVNEGMWTPALGTLVD